MSALPIPSPDPRPGLKLYEIASGLAAIDAVLEETGGMLSVELEEQLDALELALPAKVDNICAMIREAERAEESCRAEAKFFADKARVYANKQVAWKGYLKRHLESIGRDSVEGARFKVGIQNSPPSCKWTGDPERIPADYLVLTPSFDSKAALADAKAGKELPDGVVVEQGRHVRIR